MRLLLKRVQYKKDSQWIDGMEWINAFTESVFLMGFIVLSMDILWMLVCAARFLPMYPQDISQVLLVLARDGVGMIFCYLLVGERIKDGIISFNYGTSLAYLLLLGFFALVFMVAPNPTWTDWTYAIRQGCDMSTILYSLLVPYGMGKAFGTIVIWTWWRKR